MGAPAWGREDARDEPAGEGAAASAPDDAFEEYRSGLLGLVRSRLGSRSPWVEDVVQDIFVQVHRRKSTFEGRSTFKTWVYGIAINVCRDYLRRERRRHAAWGTEREDVEELQSLPDGSLDPLERLEREERARRVRQAIARLSPAHRDVLRLRDYANLSYEDIALVLHVPVGTVRSRLHNARAALAVLLIESVKE